MRRTRWAAAIVAAAAAALTACSGTPAPAPAGEPSTLAAYYAQHLNWQPCDGGFECAQFVVPFDYAKPDGPRFTLPVVKLPAADPAHRVGTLVINPGGPGGSGVQYALGARLEFPAAVLARFDIVGFDPRGVGASQPALNCENGPQLDTFFATDDEPSDPAQLARVIAASKQFAAQCERNSAALLPYVGTPNAARDMDVLRAALGESRLTYLGKSYGTYLGAWYAQLFPHRVRALVLDGSVDPATSSLDATIAQAQGFQGAFGSFAAWCLSAPGCPLEGSVADGAMLLYGVADALYSRSSWPILKVALASAFTGDGTGLVELANQLYGRNPNGTYSTLANAVTAIDCLDRPWPRSLAPWQSAAATAEKAAPMFGAAIVWGSLTCAYWPIESYPQPRIKAAGAPPILVVGTLRDPATPYRWAQAMAADLASGVLLGWNGDGHTAYGEGSACVDTIVNDYLIDLAVPRGGTVCQH